VSLYDRVRELPLAIESYALDGLELLVRPDFVRKTTIVRLQGAGEEGVGEDVTYAGDEHDRLQRRGPVWPLAGEWTLHSFSRHLGGLQLFEAEPEQHAYLDYRRWAFESAALDLALRQAGVSLGEATGRRARPVTFVVSGGLGDPPTTERVRAILELYPGLRFKLDARPTWDDALLGELADLGCVDSIDFKGQYSGTIVDNPADPGLYRRVAEAFPDAWLEDPALTDETIAVLEPHAARVTWDAPIHSVADIEALMWPPRTVNVKPSRFGSVERLFAAYDHCAEHGIGAYGGGQFELGPGRGHIQLLAALFHPDTPNDVAPGGFNESMPRSGLPSSPLTVVPRPTGFLADSVT
jgi:L-alanine-DL-glutamate epimerase-like enolase superfamily enzyme